MKAVSDDSATLELAAFDKLKANIALFVQPTLEIQVVDAQTSQAAIDTAKEIKSYRDLVEKKRKELVEPLNRRVKMINDYAKTISEPLLQSENHVRGELNAFAAEQEKIRQAALRKAEAERQERERKLAEERAREEAELRERQEEEARTRQEAADFFGAEDPEAVAEAARKAELERQELQAKYEREKMVSLVEHKQKTFDAGQAQIKNTRRNYRVRVVDISQVPKEFLIIQVNEKAALAAMKAGVKISGLEMDEEIAVAIGSKTYMPGAE